MELATCRPDRGQPIPWTAVHAYAQAHGVRDEGRLLHLVRVMDRAVMEAADG